MPNKGLQNLQDTCFICITNNLNKWIPVSESQRVVKVKMVLGFFDGYPSWILEGILAQLSKLQEKQSPCHVQSLITSRLESLHLPKTDWLQLEQVSSVISCIGSHCEFLQSLDLSFHRAGVSAAQLHQAIVSVPWLKELRLRSTNFDGETLLWIGQNFANLVTLDISDCRRCQKKIHEFVVVATDSLAFSLQHFNIDGLPIESATVKLLLSRFRNLLHLRLDGCIGEALCELDVPFHFDSVDYFSESISLLELFASIQGKALNLREFSFTIPEGDTSLDVRSPFVNLSAVPVTSLTVKNFSSPDFNFRQSSLPAYLSNWNLCSLTVQSAHLYFDISVLLRSCPNLKQLTIDGSIGSSESSLEVPVPLRAVALCGQCSEAHEASAVRCILQDLSELESLKLFSLQHVCDQVIFGLVEAPKLKTLQLARCPYVTDDFVADLCKQSTSLESLDCFDCFLTTRACFENIEADCGHVAVQWR